MNRVYRMVHRGFTLVELLIVVIILALLAAIVVPQFASSTDDAKISALDSTLANMRGVIDLYYQQHGNYPGKNTSVDAACTATDGTGIGGVGAGGVQAFIDQLSMFTNAAGGACSVKDGNFKYGPYLKKIRLPENPITGVADLEVVDTGDILMAASGANLGWKYDINVGKFIANDDSLDANGNSYDTH